MWLEAPMVNSLVPGHTNYDIKDAMGQEGKELAYILL